MTIKSSNYRYITVKKCGAGSTCPYYREGDFVTQNWCSEIYPSPPIKDTIKTFPKWCPLNKTSRK